MASEEERREVESWAKQYPEVEIELRNIELGMENYALTHAIAPSEQSKEKVFAKINTAKVYSISSGWKWAAAASILLLIGSLIFNYTYYQKYQESSSELATTKNELLQQKELAQSMHTDMDMMTNKEAMPVSLKGIPEVPNAAARIYWMQDTHEVYVDPSNLPAPPTGMQYQFWGIVDGKPVSGGLIKTLPDGSKVRLQKMKSFGKAEAFAVSLEKAGPEMPAPTKVYVIGKII